MTGRRLAFSPLPQRAITLPDHRNIKSGEHTQLNAGSGDLAIGSGATINKQVLADELTKLIRAVEDGPGDENEKKTAISRLKSALGHPLITSVVGAIAGALVA